MRFETRRIKPTIPSSVPRPFPPFLASPQPSQTACLPHVPSPFPSAGPDVPPRPYISRPNPIPPPASTHSLSTSFPFPCHSFPPLLPYLPPPRRFPSPAPSDVPRVFGCRVYGVAGVAERDKRPVPFAAKGRRSRECADQLLRVDLL